MSEQPTDNTGGEGQPRPPLRVERWDADIALVVIDCPGRRQNTLDGELINEASRVLDELEKDHSYQGVVFASGKADSFIAGADINLISACRSAEEVTALSHTGQRIFDRIQAFRVPVVAAIDGVCLGGGLELALACHARIASDADRVRLGFPEIKLGLIPGSGGTQRLPRLIGTPAALDLMLTGREVRAPKARRLGLLDEIVPRSILREAAIRRVRQLAKKEPSDTAGSSASIIQRALAWGLDGNAVGRRAVLLQARRKTRAKTHGNYPAPPKLLDCVETGLRDGMEAGLKAEAQAFGELAMTREARELIRIYFATTEMKKDRGVDDPSVEPRSIRRVAVLGAGLMGAGIVFVTIDRGRLPVRLKEVKAEGLSNGLAHIDGQIRSRLERRSLTPFEAELEMQRVTPTLDFAGFRGVDVVIEAVFEDPDLKRRMISDIETHASERTIFATNTSSLPLSDIVRDAGRPEQVVGMHYFSPVEKMPLLEVIAHDRTAPDVIATAVDLGRRQGKTPIVVRDGAGFYVNRILAPYLNEAVHLLGEGVAIDRIDRALVEFGFPVGPFKLLDEVGIDISAHVAPILHSAFGERMKPVETTERMVEDGRMGRKSGRGFYRYDGRHAGKSVDPSVYELLGVTPDRRLRREQIVNRTLLVMLNEAVRCLDEGVIRGPRDGDIGAVFGIGFPPFLGGPFRYLDSRGVSEIETRLKGFQADVGPRYAPAERLSAMAREGRRFHAD